MRESRMKRALLVVIILLLWLLPAGLVVEVVATHRRNAMLDGAGKAKLDFYASAEQGFPAPIRQYSPGGVLPESALPPRESFPALDEQARQKMAEVREEVIILCDGILTIQSVYFGSADPDLARIGQYACPGMPISDLLPSACREGFTINKDSTINVLNFGIAEEIGVKSECEFCFHSFPEYRQDGRLVCFVRRSGWERPWYSFRPNIHWTDSFYAEGWDRLMREFCTNSRGFRDREFAVPKPTGTYRILCIGGSTVVEGITNALTYPKILERKLSSILNTTQVEVFNCGVFGLVSSDEKNRISEFLALEPDMVIYYNFINDLRLCVPRWIKATPREHPLKALKYSLRRSNFVFTTCNSWLLPDRAEIQESMKHDILDNLTAVGVAAARSGASVVFCSFAHPDAGTTNQYERSIFEWDIQRRFVPALTFESYVTLNGLFNQLLREMCNEHGYQYVPVQENLTGGADIFVDSCHLNLVGIERKAEIVCEAIKEEVARALSRENRGSDQ